MKRTWHDVTTLDVPIPLDPSGIRAAVDNLLHEFLDEQERIAGARNRALNKELEITFDKICTTRNQSYP